MRDRWYSYRIFTYFIDCQDSYQSTIKDDSLKKAFHNKARYFFPSEIKLSDLTLFSNMMSLQRSEGLLSLHLLLYLKSRVQHKSSLLL